MAHTSLDLCYYLCWTLEVLTRGRYGGFHVDLDERRLVTFADDMDPVWITEREKVCLRLLLSSFKQQYWYCVYLHWFSAWRFWNSLAGTEEQTNWHWAGLG